MQNVYLIRTAAVVSIAAGLVGLGFLGMQSDAPQILPGMVSVSTASLSEPAYYFPAGFELKPNAAEPEFVEYY
jgi:hypothetical protein